MQNSFYWKAEYFEIVIVFLTVSFGFLVYYFFSNSALLQNTVLRKINSNKKPIYRVVFQRLTGFVFLGVIPFSIGLLAFPRNITDFGLSFTNSLSSLFWILIISAFIVPMNLLNARKENNLRMYPQIRYKKWNFGLIFLSAVTWMFFLLAYEFLFRGFLLFSCEKAFGAWPAIAVNVAVYSFVHLPKGRKETIGAIPLGFILCFLTLNTGNIWAAYWIHVVLALSNEWISLAIHPDMEVLLFRKK